MKPTLSVSSRLFLMPPPPLSSTYRLVICRQASWGPLDPSWGSSGAEISGSRFTFPIMAFGPSRH
eukprot:7931157-Pyramimonas_sp.AAC.1